MPDIPFFSKKNSKRIADIVPFAENLMNMGSEFHGVGHTKVLETIYIQLTEEDPNGESGFWIAEEVYYDSNNEWIIVEGGRKWNDGDRDFIRHISFGRAEIGQIVKAKLIVNTDSGVEEWVFTNIVTSPLSFIFAAEDNGNNGQALSGSIWITKNIGRAFTNVGELDVTLPPGGEPGEFRLAVGDTVQVTLIFVDFGSGFILASASMNIGTGPYWTKNSDNSLTVNVRIAEVEEIGDIGRLIQFHSGDIYLEIFDFSSDEDDPDDDYLLFVGDGLWIDVSKVGNTITTSHIKPVPDQPKAVFKALDEAFDCDSVSFSTLQDAEDWANTLLSALIRVKWDLMGHIYETTNCDGTTTIEETENTVSILSSIMEAFASGSSISPEDIGGDGLLFDYTVFDQGKNFADYINVRNMTIGIRNSLGTGIPFAIVANTADGLKQSSFIALAENVAGTSGLADSAHLSTRQFRFNDTIKISGSTNGVGLPAFVELQTAAVVATNAVSTSIVRDVNDPLDTTMTVTISYDLAGLGSTTTPELAIFGDDSTPYYVTLSFNYADGSAVRFSALDTTGNSTGITNSGFVDLELSTTSSTTELSMFFHLRDAVEAGDIINMCSKLIADNGDFNANVEQCTALSIQEVSDCITDGIDQVTDDSGECIEGESVVYRKVSDNTEIGVTASTASSFIWAKDPSSGEWVKAFSGTGTSTTAILCIVDNGFTLESQLTLDDFSLGTFSSFPIDNGCDIIESTGFSFPTRTAGVNHSFPAGLNFRDINYNFGNGGVDSTDDFDFEATIATNNISVGSVGQVTVQLVVEWSSGNISRVRVKHNDSGLTALVGYVFGHDTSGLSTADTNVTMTRADYSGLLKIERRGTTVNMIIDSVTNSATIGINETIVSMSVSCSNTAGPGTRAEGWDVDISNITINEI